MENGKHSQIEKLKLQQERLKAKIQKMEASERTKIKKQDTRQKILIGAMIMEESLKEGTFDVIKDKLKTFLTRDSDRALFNLPPLLS